MLENIFQKMKQVITKEIEEGVKLFDPNKTSAIIPDWFKTGVGFMLMQKHCNCEGEKIMCCPGGWKCSLVGSRFTTKAEANYAPVEGE